MFRHDRASDLARFRNVPHHGFFINRDITDLAYTIMATGDNIVLENGERDGGLGRTLLFSSPRTCGAGVILGNTNNDNSRKITVSRDLSQIFWSCIRIYIILPTTQRNSTTIPTLLCSCLWAESQSKIVNLRLI